MWKSFLIIISVVDVDIKNSEFNKNVQRWLRGGEMMGREKRRTFSSYEELEDAIKTLFKDMLHGYPLERYVKIKEVSDDTVKAYIYTEDNYYVVVATTGGYLGCQSSPRRNEAGDEFNRGGRDLADGPFTNRTWGHIKNDIINTELIQLGRRYLTNQKENEVEE